jgi:hypothetical protein
MERERERETAHSLYVDAASIEKILACQHSFLPQEVIVTHLTCYKKKKYFRKTICWEVGDGGLPGRKNNYYNAF